LHRELVRLADGVATRLRAHGTGARTFQLKVRFAGFHTITRAVTVPASVQTAHGIVQAVEPLLQAIDPSPGVRLLGVSSSNFAEAAQQLSMDDLLVGDSGGVVAGAGEWQAAEATMDAIRSRFGRASIGPASAVRRDGLHVVRKGGQQWGPDENPG
jgi:DNA polymerase-4